MKKNLLKSVFVTLALAFTAIAAQAQCYIIGNDGKWLTNEAGAELQPTAEKGIYEGNVEFTTSYYFFVATKLTAEPNDWDGLLPYRYGPANRDSRDIVYGTPMQMVPATADFSDSYQIADLGTHKIRVDFNANTVTVDGTYPEHIYVFGTDKQPGEEWKLNEPSATLNRVDGTSLYTGKVEVTGATFAIFTKLADTWDEQNKNRWIVKGEVVPNTELSLKQATDLISTIHRMGTYQVTYNYGKKTIKFYDETYSPEPETTKYIYFIGDQNDWNINSYFAKIPETKEGVYEGNVNFEVGYFAIVTKLGVTANDWDTFNAHRFCPYSDGESLDACCDLLLYKFDEGMGIKGSFQIEKGYEGEYPVYINLNENNLKFGHKVETSITNITSTSANVANYYDLTGRNLGTKKPAKGLYIKGGKKVVVK